MKLKAAHRVRNIEGLECWAKDLANNNNGNCGASYVALVVKNPAANAGDIRDAGLIPGSERFPWRAWQSTPVWLPGEIHGQRILLGYSP